MWTWMRTAMGVTAMLVPGGLLVLLAWGLGRALWLQWRVASAEAHGEAVPFRRVLQGVSVRGVVRETFAV
jgi:hypothetical protein